MIQEEILEFETKLDYNSYRKFYLFSLFKNKVSKYCIIICIVILSLSFLLQLSLSFIFDSYSIDPLILLVIILFVFYFVYIIFFHPKLYYKTAKKYYEHTSIYRFSDEYIFSETKSGLMIGTSQFKYDIIYKLYETNDAFYIFVSKIQALIIIKDNHSKEANNKLSELLRLKLGKKYINRSKNEWFLFIIS